MAKLPTYEEMAKDIAERALDTEYKGKTLREWIEQIASKQSEGEWVDRYNGKYDNPIYVCSVCRRGTLIKYDINELGNMQMIQALSLFCPNCGARMKGGAE